MPWDSADAQAAVAYELLEASNNQWWLRRSRLQLFFTQVQGTNLRNTISFALYNTLLVSFVLEFLNERAWFAFWFGHNDPGFISGSSKWTNLDFCTKPWCVTHWCFNYLSHNGFIEVSGCALFNCKSYWCINVGIRSSKKTTIQEWFRVCQEYLRYKSWFDILI